MHRRPKTRIAKRRTATHEEIAGRTNAQTLARPRSMNLSPFKSRETQMTKAKTSRKPKAIGDRLNGLIEQFKATGQAIVIADTAEEKAQAKYPRPEAPGVLGGKTPHIEMTVDGKPHVVQSVPYYYRTHEEIDRSTVGAERKRLHAALTRAEKAADKAIHPAVRAREAEANRAHEVDMAARDALLRFRPRSTAEAVAFLQFLASDPSLPRETEMVRCLRNIAAAIKSRRGAL
jgi:hypothetical protein